MLRKTLSLVMLAAILAGCATAGRDLKGVVQGESAVQVQQAAMTKNEKLVEAVEPTTVAVQPTQSPTIAVEEAATAAPTSTTAPTQTIAPTVAVPLGPDQFPEGINPLTGLPVNNPETLAYAPAMVSITNFPVTARPQAGLSYSPFVFEMYVGEGMTRFLALFYGDYPQKEGEDGLALSDDKIGPVRSGRLPYESLRKLYNGFLVMASASSNVLSNLSGYTNIFGSDTQDINSALIPATKLEEIASKNPDRVRQESLTGLQFSNIVPASGLPAQQLWIPFSFLNQVIWRYDENSGAYLRYQDTADGKTFVQSTDRLNEQPLTYENVVILFADHQAERETLIDINFMYITKMPALLFRDGKMYEIFWTTANGEYERRTGRIRPIRFIDAQGNPFPLKPGQTWVEIVQRGTRYNETVQTEDYLQLKRGNMPGSGSWAVHFFPTVPER